MAALYYWVVAAEDYDLAEQARREHQNALWYDDQDSAPEEGERAVVADVEADATETDAALTITRMIGLLRHFLGAEILEEDGVDRRETSGGEGDA